MAGNYIQKKPDRHPSERLRLFPKKRARSIPDILHVVILVHLCITQMAREEAQVVHSSANLFRCSRDLEPISARQDFISSQL